MKHIDGNKEIQKENEDLFYFTDKEVTTCHAVTPPVCDYSIVKTHAHSEETNDEEKEHESSLSDHGPPTLDGLFTEVEDNSIQASHDMNHKTNCVDQQRDTRTKTQHTRYKDYEVKLPPFDKSSTTCHRSIRLNGTPS